MYAQSTGMKWLKKMIKKHDVVVSTTNKTGRLCLIGTETYRQLGDQHINDDTKITEIQDRLNAHC